MAVGMVCCNFIRDAELAKVHCRQSFSPLDPSCGPVGEAIYDNKIVDPFVVEEVDTDTQLERAVHLVERVAYGYNCCRFPVRQ